MTQPAKVISVFGSAAPRPGSAPYEAARTVGCLLAQAGLVVQTGGYTGVMSAASQGAAEAGGHVIGVTSAQIEQFRPTPANQWVKEEIKHQTLRQRLLYLVDHSDGVIVMPGGIGTLSELALVWSFVQVGELSPRPIVAVGELWQRTLTAFMDDAYVADRHKALVTLAATPEEAVSLLIALLELGSKE
ncbi:MAG: hypothetical protein Kow0031_27730 [Anaerolineae bacterium]